MADALPPTPYPATIDNADIMNVVNYVRGTLTDKAQAAHSAWLVTGYGLGQLAPFPPVMTAGSPLSDDDACKMLESLTKPQAGATALPWGKLAQWALQLLLLILAG